MTRDAWKQAAWQQAVLFACLRPPGHGLRYSLYQTFFSAYLARRVGSPISGSLALACSHTSGVRLEHQPGARPLPRVSHPRRGLNTQTRGDTLAGLVSCTKIGAGGAAIAVRHVRLSTWHMITSLTPRLASAWSATLAELLFKVFRVCTPEMGDGRLASPPPST